MADEVDHANKLTDDRNVVEIRTIQRSLQQKNETGLCIDCEEDIESERLAALPSARRCISCQESMERNSRIYRH